jgi:hypothetical protein
MLFYSRAELPSDLIQKCHIVVISLKKRIFEVLPELGLV